METVHMETMRTETVRMEAVRRETVRMETVRMETVRMEPLCLSLLGHQGQRIVTHMANCSACGVMHVMVCYADLLVAQRS